jgi:hypothetical protein
MKSHTSRRTRIRLKTKTKMRGTGQCKKVKFVFHTKQGLHPLDTATSQLIDVYCEDRIELKDTISMEQTIYRKASTQVPRLFKISTAKYENRIFTFAPCINDN